MAGDFTCEIELLDLTESLDEPLAAELEQLCCFALGLERPSDSWAVSLVLTSDEHLTRLHEEFMGILEPTDILTFPDDDEPGGDIVISIEQAERQRHDDGWSLNDELRFLTVHGALHLAGWDDRTSELRASMLARQREVIAHFQAGPSSRR